MSQPGVAVPSSSRRRFLHQLGIAVVGGIVSLLTAVPLVGYFFSVLTKKPSLQWVRLCSLDQVDSEQPREFRITFPGENSSVPYQAVQGVFVLRHGDQILVFSNVCTHMGCSVRWLAWRQQIICPCHGGMYDRWGHLMGGPPSSDLPLYLSRIEDNDLYVANRIIQRGVTTEGG
ncbi:MAG TPA: ubiquinol-cytochrome c reductase iron-sulfur subunit [Chloroflexota bacterium]|nr:ubiquinol-cytochrome c reductase iron-sulfur subunit [Chloroflexota bacterium]